MAKLFISYSREDRDTVDKLAACLEGAGHSVWWDRHIKAGSMYEKDIEAALSDADAVIVAWSRMATQSGWVKDEAAFARDAGKLVPICLSDCEAPLGFRQYQTMDFQRWRGDKTAPVWGELLAAIADKTGDAPPPAPALSPLQRLMAQIRRSPVDLVAGVAGAIAFAGLATVFFFRGDDAGPGAGAATLADSPAETVSIAVLPFVDMSPDGDQQYFGDGLSEELLNVLARVDRLKVASRTSSFALRDKPLDAGEIADKLGVGHIVEGSIRKSNNRIRVTAQLVDARTDAHVWSDTYDRQLADIFRIQDEIANSIVNALREKLGVSEERAITIVPATENLNAYDLYLKARELFIDRNRINIRDSLDIFERIVAMQPDYADAWEGLSAVYGVATSYGIRDRDYSALSIEAANRALQLDASLSMPYAVIGLSYRTHYPTPWAASLDNLRKAIANDPANTSAHLWLGMNFMALGYHDDALAAFGACLDADEAFLLCRRYKSIVHLFRGESRAGLALAEKNAEAGHFNDFDVYIPLMLERGDRLTAFTISRFVNWWEDFPHADYIDAVANPDGVAPERFAALEKWAERKKVDIYDQTNLVLTYRAYDRITVDTFSNDYEDLWLPAFGDFRASPAFKRLARELGLVDYWSEHGFPDQCRRVGEDDFECA